MRLPKLAINNYQFVLIIVLLAMIIGVTSYITMPKAEDPSMKSPYHVVSIIYPGTSAKDIEELVIDPLEKEINKVEDVFEIITTISEGLATIQVQTVHGVDVDQKHDDILSKINSVKPTLPKDIYDIGFMTFSPQDAVIKQIAIISETASFEKMKDVAESIEDKINKIQGIRDVEIVAYPEKEIRISLDFHKMSRLKISLNRVLGIIESNNTNMPGGDISAGQKSFTIKTSGSFKSIKDIQNLKIISDGQKLVYLKDIADINFDYEEYRYQGRFNGERCIFLSVTQKERQNIFAISEAIDVTLAQVKEKLPRDIRFETVVNQAELVDKRVNGFFVSLIQGIVLVGLIVLIFVGWRPSLIVMTVIPLSIVIALGALNTVGYGIQQISIAGLVISLGLLVDNGIVVVENIIRYMRLGYPIKEAAIKGTSEVGWALVSSTATTVASFLPMALMNNDTGDFLISLSFIVGFALTTSLFLALAISPMLATRVLKRHDVKKESIVERGVNWFIINVYRKALNFSLRNTAIAIFVALGCFIGSLMLFKAVGVSFFPDAEKPMALIYVDTPDGSNLEYTKKATNYVEGILDSTEYVKNYATNIGHGNPKIYYNIFPKSFDKTHGQLLVNLKEWNRERFAGFIADMREDFRAYPGAKITIKELVNGPPFVAPIEIKVLGKDIDVLKSVSKDLKKIIQNTEGTIDVFNPLALNKVDLKVKINKEKAAFLGIQIAEIDLAVRAALTGVAAADITTMDGKKYNLIVRLPVDERTKINDFNEIYLTTRTGAIVPIKQVARLEFQGGTSQIQHFNLERTAVVTASLAPGFNTKDVTETILGKLNDYHLPPDYSFYIAGEYETQQESFTGMAQLLIIVLIGIYAILVLQFKSFAQPLIIYSAIPLAFIGSIFALYITGWEFSFLAFVGMTSLVGIVINDSILLVDYANQLRSNGASIIHALKKSCETRFQPVILTSLTTVLGLLPLTLTNSSMWSPMGWTIIGGMITSTFLILLIVPVLYLLFSSKKTS